MLIFGLCAVMPGFAAFGAQRSSYSGSYYSTSPVKTNVYRTSSTSRKIGGSSNTITNNFYYYGQPETADSGTASYRAYPVSGAKINNVKNENKKRYSVVENTRQSQMRKYFLAHPFFQPLQGRVGSVTDVSYAQNRFNFDLLDGVILDLDRNSATYNQIIAEGLVNMSGKQETSQFLVKQDFSFGLTDRIALMGMAQYDKTKVSINDWSTGEPGDSSSSSGINIFGVGLQGRFVDNEKWIATLSGFYQRQKDTANMFMGELKLGYKIDRTTLYGLGRVSYLDLTKGNAYGAFVDSDGGDYLMLAYNTNVKHVMYSEGGVGAFAVLNKYFTLNGELIYGYYDWHQQLNIKGAIGWQPGDMFALNVYASTALYDSGKGKVKQYLNYDVNPDVSDFPSAAQDTKQVYTIGDYKIKDYNEWKFGVQAILYF